MAMDEYDGYGTARTTPVWQSKINHRNDVTKALYSKNKQLYPEKDALSVDLRTSLLHVNEEIWPQETKHLT